MKKLLTKFAVTILCGAMLLGVCLACACSKNSGGAGGKTERVFLTDSDYDKVKDGLKGKGALSDEAKSKATQELIAGQKYCFVYAFELKDTAPLMSSRTLKNYLNFSLKTWGGIYFGADAVDFVGFDYDDTGKDICLDSGIQANFNLDNGAMTLEKKSEGYYEEGLYHHLKSFVCIKFVPKYAGTIYVESNIYGEYYKKAEDNRQWISASVFTSASAAANGDKCNISGLSYGLVNGEVYNSGLLDENTDLAAISDMKIGENYVVVDFDIEAINSDGTGEVYCGIYLHKGAWKDAVLEDANTSKTAKTEVDGGTVFDFAYKVPASGSRRIRTVLSFTALDVCLVDIDFYMFSEASAISGITYDGEHFSEESVAKLKYEIDEDMQICRVTGMEGINGNVIIPDRYQGYPVLEVKEEAFSASHINTLIIGNMVQTVGYRAFCDCSQLSSVIIGNRVNTIQGSAFKGTNISEIRLPASLYSIGSYAFADCESLQSAIFENEIGWQLYAGNKDKIYTGYFPVSNAKTAANNLTEKYSHIGWYYGATAEVSNFSVGAVLAGDWSEAVVNPGSSSLNNLLEKKSYVLIIDFDLTTLSQVIDPYSMDPNTVYVGIKNFDLLNLTLDTFTSVSGEFYGENIVSDTGIGLQCTFPSRIGETTHYRVACSFKPRFGGNTLKIKFDGGFGRTALTWGTYEISERFSVVFK